MSVATSRGLTESPASAGPVVCPCGQELDICARKHCPRCGINVVHVRR